MRATASWSSTRTRVASRPRAVSSTTSARSAASNRRCRRDECFALEPSLALAASRLSQRVAGGIYTPSEEVGDCYRFCVGLEHRLVALGVRLRLGVTAGRLSRPAIGSRTSRRTAATSTAEAFVLALGAKTPWFARPLGLRLPVYPLKGYSLTLPVIGASPAVSVTDFKRKVVYAPLEAPCGRQLRVAGMADIAGILDAARPGARAAARSPKRRRRFPDATDYRAHLADMQPWTGLRPATPKGRRSSGARRSGAFMSTAGRVRWGGRSPWAAAASSPMRSKGKSEIQLEQFSLHA